LQESELQYLYPKIAL